MSQGTKLWAVVLMLSLAGCRPETPDKVLVCRIGQVETHRSATTGDWYQLSERAWHEWHTSLRYVAAANESCHTELAIEKSP